MPRENIPLDRLTNILEQERFLIVACEGFTEKAYIRQFSRMYLEHRSVKHKIKVLDRSENEESFSAPQHVLKQLKEFKAEFSAGKSDLCWMIIDRDRWPNLSTILQECRSLGFNHAVSSPSFEVWCLCHCLDLRNVSQETIDIIERNPKPTKKRFLEKKLSEEMQKHGLGGFSKKQNFEFHANFLDSEKIIMAIEQCIYFEEKERLLNQDEYQYPKVLGSQVHIFIDQFKQYLSK
ncbi:RloB family protein [Acinetobacter wuhouensis]|uniref:RloB family protein n=1 Tax=Acinetobacter wuhouensis TaxID=1879050 RepID=UPI00083ADD1F|nr:RloB family protein [Acinetobacter wuhouensis]